MSLSSEGWIAGSKTMNFNRPCSSKLKRIECSLDYQDEISIQQLSYATTKSIVDE